MFEASLVAIDRHFSTTASGFVERFKPLPPGPAARSTPKTGTVGTVAVEHVDGFKPLGDGTQRDPRPDDGRHIAHRSQAHHRGVGESHR